MLSPTYPLRTERLLLRPLTDDDFDDLYAFQSDPDVTRYVSYDTRDRDGMRAALEAKRRETALTKDGDALSLAVTVPPDPTVIGEVNLFLQDTANRMAEIGYVFHPGYQGHGYALEAAREMLRAGFEDARMHRMTARCDARNTASWKLMEKLGMRREADFVQGELFKGGVGGPADLRDARARVGGPVTHRTAHSRRPGQPPPRHGTNLRWSRAAPPRRSLARRPASPRPPRRVRFAPSSWAASSAVPDTPGRRSRGSGAGGCGLAGSGCSALSERTVIGYLLQRSLEVIPGMKE